MRPKLSVCVGKRSASIYFALIFTETEKVIVK